MTTNISAEALAQQIEQLVENFIAGGRRAAAAAMERAFASARPTAQRSTRSTRRARKLAPRRTPAEMAALSERLYDAVCAKPGETMSVLAPVVGVTSRALQVPAVHLKKAGRIRSVGQKQHTRYFPMVKNSSKAG